MKFVSVAALTLFTAFIAIQAQASNKPALSADLKKRVLEAAYAKCELETALVVKIENVSVKRKKVDQYIYDYFYTITLNAAVENKNEEILNQKVIVKAAEYNISNPAIDPYEIISVSSPNADFCQ